MTGTGLTDLASKVVFGDPGNTDYQYLNSSNAEKSVPLGNLQVGSSATHLQDLVNKWFLGEDYPDPTTYYNGVAQTPTPSYALASGNLCSSGGPSYNDVYQGNDGDCWLLASYAETAAHDAVAIKNMFTYDGTVDGAQVWTVCFYDNGVASYLTVNNYFPYEINPSYEGTSYTGDYFEFAHDSLNQGQLQSISDPSNVLWVPLAEKAYAQLCESGWNGQPSSNAYASLSGEASWTLPVITGLQESHSNLLASEGSFISAINSQTLLTLDSYPGDSSPIVGDHCYAVISYNPSDQSFELLNPWGVNNKGDYGADPGILNLNWNQLTANFYLDGNCPQPVGPVDASPSATISEAESLPQTGSELSPSVGSLAPRNGTTSSNDSADTLGWAATALRDAAIADLVLPTQSVAASVDVYDFPVLRPRPLQRIGQVDPRTFSGDAS